MDKSGGTGFRRPGSAAEAGPIGAVQILKVLRPRGESE